MGLAAAGAISAQDADGRAARHLEYFESCHLGELKPVVEGEVESSNSSSSPACHKIAVCGPPSPGLERNLGEPGSWQGLCEVLELPGWTLDSGFCLQSTSTTHVSSI